MLNETCEQYHTRRCEGTGPHQSNRNGPQGIRHLITPSVDKQLCHECYKRTWDKHLNALWAKLPIVREAIR